MPSIGRMSAVPLLKEVGGWKQKRFNKTGAEHLDSVLKEGNKACDWNTLGEKQMFYSHTKNRH